MKLRKTERDFEVGEFEDLKGRVCSLQQSSLITEDCIWLGLKDASPKILAVDARRLGLEVSPDVSNTEWIDYHIPGDVLTHTRMHLNRDGVMWFLETIQSDITEEIRFEDFDGCKCSLGKGFTFSNVDFVWFGMDYAAPQILASKARELGMEIEQQTGWTDYPVPKEVVMHTQMSLDEEGLGELVKRLKCWLESGSFGES